MKIGQKNILGTFAADQYVKIYENILSSAATSITISGLDGDTDEEYRLILRYVNGCSGGTNICAYYNNDTNLTNYGGIFLQGVGPGTSSFGFSPTTDVTLYIGRADSSGNLSFSDTIIYAKSGYIRTSITTWSRNISGTTVSHIQLFSAVWNNTSTNITSLVIKDISDYSNALGIGTSIELWKKKYKS